MFGCRKADGGHVADLAKPRDVNLKTRTGECENQSTLSLQDSGNYNTK